MSKFKDNHIINHAACAVPGANTETAAVLLYLDGMV